MKKNLLCLVSVMVLTVSIGFAQGGTRWGTYAKAKITENINGSPFLSDDWLPATIKMATGNLLKDFKVKYNLIDDQLYFKSDEDNRFLTFNEPVSEFRIQEPSGLVLYKNGFVNPKFGSKNTFYQVLFDGKVKLLKRLNKSVIEVQGYNEASPTKNISEQVRYYAGSVNGEVVEVKPTKKDVLAIMASKKAEIDKFLTSSRIDFKNDKDLVTLFTYYNSLI